MVTKDTTNTQEELLNIIMDITNRFCRELDSNNICEAGRLYDQRMEKMEILSKIKTSDIVNLPNYRMFIASLRSFSDKFCCA